jgi:hypothetical protein
MNVRSIERKPVGYDQRQFAVCGIYTSYRDPRRNLRTGSYLEAQFRVLFAGEPTKKSIELSDTGRTINAALDYAGSKGSREGKPVVLEIGIIVSDKEENAVDAHDSVKARTRYSRDWLLSVTYKQLVGELTYTLTLSCSDGNTKRRSDSF